MLVVYSLSRLARSIRHMLDFGEELQTRGIGLMSLTEAIDTTSPAGRFVFTLMGALNALEVDLLRERTRAGLDAARARGRVGGRPRALDAHNLKVARALIADGQLTIAEVAQQVGCAPSTLYRAIPSARTGLQR